MEKTKTEQQELKEQALTLCEGFKGYEVSNSDQYELAAGDLKKAKEMIKALDAKRKEMTKPLDESKKKIMAFFKPATDKLNGAVAIINQAMFVYRRKQEEIAQKQREEIGASSGEEDIFTPEVKAEIPKTEIKVRKSWKFKIKDKSKIDDKFLIPDEKTIGELVRKIQDKAEYIVGKGSIEIYFEETSY